MHALSVKELAPLTQVLTVPGRRGYEEADERKPRGCKPKEECAEGLRVVEVRHVELGVLAEQGTRSERGNRIARRERGRCRGGSCRCRGGPEHCSEVAAREAERNRNVVKPGRRAAETTFGKGRGQCGEKVAGILREVAMRSEIKHSLSKVCLTSSALGGIRHTTEQSSRQGRTGA